MTRTKLPEYERENGEDLKSSGVKGRDEMER